MKLVLILLLFSFNLSAHPVHLSITNIEYNSKSKTFDISIRLFKDDFTTILNQKYTTSVNLNKMPPKKQTQKLINDYITENLQLTIDDYKIEKNKYKLYKSEIKDLTVWLYYKIPFKKTFQNVQLSNSLMFDLYPDQKNMLIFTLNNKQFAYELFKTDYIKTISL